MAAAGPRPALGQPSWRTAGITPEVNTPGMLPPVLLPSANKDVLARSQSLTELSSPEARSKGGWKAHLEDVHPSSPLRAEPTRSVAQGRVQLSSERLYGWRFHSLSGPLPNIWSPSWWLAPVCQCHSRIGEPQPGRSTTNAVSQLLNILRRITFFNLLAALEAAQPSLPLAFFITTAYCWNMFTFSPTRTFSAKLLLGQSVLVHGVIPSQIQDSALAFVRLHEVPASPSSGPSGALQAAVLPFSVFTVLRAENWLRVCSMPLPTSLTETLNVIRKVQQVTCHQLDLKQLATAHLSLTVQSVFHPLYRSHQFGYKDIIVDRAESLMECDLPGVNTCCLFPITFLPSCPSSTWTWLPGGFAL